MVKVPKASGDLPPPLKSQLFGLVVWLHSFHVCFVHFSWFHRSLLWGCFVKSNRSQTNVCLRTIDGIVDWGSVFIWLRKHLDLWHAVMLINTAELSTDISFLFVWVWMNLALQPSTWAERRIRRNTVTPYVLVDLLRVLHERDKVLAFVWFDWILESLIVGDFLSVVRFHVAPEEVVLDGALLLFRVPNSRFWLSVFRVFPLEIRHLEELLG